MGYNKNEYWVNTAFPDMKFNTSKLAIKEIKDIGGLKEFTKNNNRIFKVAITVELSLSDIVLLLPMSNVIVDEVVKEKRKRTSPKPHIVPSYMRDGAVISSHERGNNKPGCNKIGNNDLINVGRGKEVLSTLLELTEPYLFTIPSNKKKRISRQYLRALLDNIGYFVSDKKIGELARYLMDNNMWVHDEERISPHLVELKYYTPCGQANPGYVRYPHLLRPPMNPNLGRPKTTDQNKKAKTVRSASARYYAKNRGMILEKARVKTEGVEQDTLNDSPVFSDPEFKDDIKELE